MITRSCLALLILCASAASAMAQPSTVAHHIAAAQQAFGEGHYAEAVRQYEIAFALDTTSENALRVVIAACYAVDFASATTRLDTWLLRKRADAKRLLDNDPSWKLVESLGKALQHASDEKDRRIEQLQRQLEEERIKVVTVRSDYHRQLREQQLAFKRQLDQISAKFPAPPE